MSKTDRRWWFKQTQDFRERYVYYWDSRYRTRYGRRCWFEGIERKPVEGTIGLFKDSHWWDAATGCTPFLATGDIIRHRLDQYYTKRFHWRRWNNESVRCAARRVWGAGI